MPLLFLFAIIYGFAHGGMFTAVSPLVTELFGMHAHGLLYGTVIFIGTIAGAVYDLIESYRPAFMMLIVLILVAAAAMASIRPRVTDGQRNVSALAETRTLTGITRQQKLTEQAFPTGRG